jgi:hypothetical protein
VLGDLVDGIVVRQDRDRGATADEAAHNVFLDTAIDEGNVQVGAWRLNNKRGLCADTLDKVHLAGVEETFVLVGIVLVANGNPGKRGALFSEESDNLSGIDARDGRDAFTGTPVAEALDGSPMAVLKSDIGNDDTSSLEMGGFEVLEEIPLVALF